jgi:hypothetical protein
MYTYKLESNPFSEKDYYIIYDPDGVSICSVNFLEDAKALLSHLNRE